MRTFIIMALMLVSAIGFAQSADESMAAALRVGNHKELSKYFDTKLDMAILGKENSHSKAQAEQIVKDFFEKHRVSGHQVIHRGSSRDGARYAIGSLSTSTGTYRTYILIRGDGDKARIQQLRIEIGD